MANPFQGDDEDPFSGVRDEEGGIKRAAPKKNRIVTKEELKKSGFTNLRDFLNAERGLKRRDGKAPSKAEPAKPEAKAETPKDMPAATKSGSRNPNRTTGAVKSSTPGFLSRMFSTNDNPRLRRERAEKEEARDRDTDVGMKKGGSVSSASKRADGCAKKGKTKGRMV